MWGALVLAGVCASGGPSVSVSVGRSHTADRGGWNLARLEPGKCLFRGGGVGWGGNFLFAEVCILCSHTTPANANERLEHIRAVKICF